MSDPLNIRHRVADRGGQGYLGASQRVVGQCVWCGGDAWTAADTPFRPDLGAVPLHLFCGVDLRNAYRAWKNGEDLTPQMVAGVSRLASMALPQQLPAGGDGAEP